MDLRRLKFGDLSVDEMYSRHTIEHIPLFQLKDTLAEWVRVLKYDGTLKINFPDFDKYIDFYIANRGKVPFFEFMRWIYAGEQPDCEYSFHRSGMNTALMVKILNELGMEIKFISDAEVGCAPYFDRQKIGTEIVAVKRKTSAG
jgi:predicted SAM-dependent methyltransferase